MRRKCLELLSEPNLEKVAADIFKKSGQILLRCNCCLNAVDLFILILFVSYNTYVLTIDRIDDENT